MDYTHRDLGPFAYKIKCSLQGSALRKITRSPKAQNHKIQCAQHKVYMKEVSLSGRPEVKVSHLRHPATLRAQPCSKLLSLKSSRQPSQLGH